MKKLQVLIKLNSNWWILARERIWAIRSINIFEFITETLRKTQNQVERSFIQGKIIFSWGFSPINFLNFDSIYWKVRLVPCDKSRGLKTENNWGAESSSHVCVLSMMNREIVHHLTLFYIRSSLPINVFVRWNCRREFRAENARIMDGGWIVERKREKGNSELQFSQGQQSDKVNGRRWGNLANRTTTETWILTSDKY